MGGETPFLRTKDHWCKWLLLLLLGGCAPQLLEAQARLTPTRAIQREANQIIKQGHLGTNVPLTEVALIRNLLRAASTLRDRAPALHTPGELRSAGRVRQSLPEVGDLLIFKELPSVPSVAMVIRRYTQRRFDAITITRGAPRRIMVDMDHPTLRRSADGKIINTYLRKILRDDEDHEGYLAGSLVEEVRAIF